jgi:uncharacterized protein YggE
MKHDNKAIVITSIISVVVLIIALISLAAVNSVSPYSKNTVSVQGSATIKASPDLITVYYDIETKGQTASEARDANSKILENLTNAITKQGFKESDLQTQNFNVYPNTYWENGKQKEDGYKASHTLKIELASDKFEKVAELVDAGVDSGAGISYINFELSPEAQNQYKAEALKLASKDAKIKAESVAEGFDQNLGKLISVQVNNFGYTPWNVYSAKVSASGSAAEDTALAREAATNITPSEQEIDATVSATYKLR